MDTDVVKSTNEPLGESGEPDTVSRADGTSSGKVEPATNDGSVCRASQCSGEPETESAERESTGPSGGDGKMDTSKEKSSTNDRAEICKVNVVKKKGVIHLVLNRLSKFGPFRFMTRVLRALSWLAGLSSTIDELGPEYSPTMARQYRSGRKRLHRATRLLLSFMPYRLQSALGYPVPSSIGKVPISEEIRCSPTKLSGKGNKRKQDDLDEEEHQSWVEALNEELGDEDCLDDPTYEPSTQEETDSEENRTHNDTESDIEVENKDGMIMIKENSQENASTPSECAEQRQS
ncbi:oogenesis-related isoform X2 [Erpetoichthys calabaricus]|uniref:oogenesis-related isoform X2 n=1 Tax=Erpetoichthys calabaricus TaxID=27687 RepID=UPI002234A0B5|nr:oogenesis-related isoform X2 [Erpetoichthys calabaricus]